LSTFFISFFISFTFSCHTIMAAYYPSM